MSDQPLPTEGDAAGSDSIAVGDISGAQAVAIGRGAQAPNRSVRTNRDRMRFILHIPDRFSHFVTELASE